MKCIDCSPTRRMTFLCHLNQLSLILVSSIHFLPMFLRLMFYEAHHYDLPINYCDEVAQLSLFLGAVSVVIFGISRRHGEFLMGVLSLILSLAMDVQDPHSESRWQNTLAQIP